MSNTPYIGRFAPSPSGALHAGSLIAAVASFLDAKAHDGKWLLRIEDIDETRSVAGADQAIIALLAQLQMPHDGEVVWQSQRKAHYLAAYQQLETHTFACACSRKEIADSIIATGRPDTLAADGAPIYPGTCRNGLAAGRNARSWRLRVPDVTDSASTLGFADRWQGWQQQNLALEVGDFVLKQVAGFWTYQMAVVVDDGLQGVTDVVRGVDLLASTARQIYLQGLLGLPTPRYLHFPVLANAAGEKLSKQTGAPAVVVGEDQASRIAALMQATQFLGLALAPVTSLDAFWQAAIAAWRRARCG